MKPVRSVGVLCAAVLALAGGCAKNEKKIESQIVTVRTAQPQERDFRDVVETQGVIEAIDHAVLSTIIAGQLEELTVKEGDAVKEGQILFRSDRKNLENRCILAEEGLKMAQERVRTKQADLNLAMVSQAKAKKDFTRNETLSTVNAVSKDKLETYEQAHQKALLVIEQANAALSTAKSEVSFAQATLNIATKKLNDADVFAPYDGIITEKLKNVNEFCNPGTPVLKIEKPFKKRISAVISGIYFPDVAIGKTKMEVSFLDRPLCTIPVTILSHTIDPVSRTFELKADLPETLRLPSGTLCSVKIILDERKSLCLPEESLLYRPNEQFAVYEVVDNKAKELPVFPGISQNGYTEIRNADAVKAHDVIVSGQYFVSNGSEVRVVKD